MIMAIDRAKSIKYNLGLADFFSVVMRAKLAESMQLLIF